MNVKIETQSISPEQREKNNRKFKTRNAKLNRSTYK